MSQITNAIIFIVILIVIYYGLIFTIAGIRWVGKSFTTSFCEEFFETLSDYGGGK